MRLLPEYRNGFSNRIALGLAWFLALSGLTIAAAFFSNNLAISVVGILMVVVGVILFRASQTKPE